jgi:Rha family phage regulatory protein
MAKANRYRVRSELLKQLREKKGVLQRDMAAQLLASGVKGLSQSVLCHLEKGVKEATMDQVTEIAKYYNVLTEELLVEPGEVSAAVEPPTPSLFDVAPEEEKVEPPEPEEEPKAAETEEPRPSPESEEERVRMVIPFVHADGDRIYVTSREIADAFKRDPKNVLKSIRELECSEEFSRLNFELTSYLDSQGKPQPECYITKNGFLFLVMGFTGKIAAQIKEAYIREFDRKDAELKALKAVGGQGTSTTQDRILEMLAQLVVQGTGDTKRVEQEVAILRLAVAPAAINKLVQENITVRSISGVPPTHISAQDILRDGLYQAVDRHVIGRMLRQARHPRDEVEIQDGKGDVHMTMVFRREGLEAAIDHVHSTVSFVRESPLRYYFTSPLNVEKLGDSPLNFVVAKSALLSSRPAYQFWVPKLPQKYADKLREQMNVTFLKRNAEGDMAPDND